jgi:hypothetical protein
MDFTNLHFNEAVVMDSLSQIVVMTQTEHFTADRNPDGHAQEGKLHWLPLPTSNLEKKKKKKKNPSCYYH